MMVRPDPRFFYTGSPLRADEACSVAGAALRSGDTAITHASGLAGADEGAVCFVEAAKALREAGPALVLTTDGLADAVAGAYPGAAIGIAPKPKAAFAVLAGHLHQPLIDLMEPLAGIAETARIAATAQVAPSAVIGEGALIHADAVIGPGTVIGPGVVIGERTRVGAHVTITHAVVGADCRFAAGVRIGEAGFGYAAGKTGAVPVPQLGRVLIGARVDLGANTCVDCGALTDTTIGDGVKIDNLCQIAHGCVIGDHVLIASLTGISGSVAVGEGAMIGGQVGMAEHIKIGAGATITARAGVMKDVPPGEKWGGAPAKPARQWLKETAALTKLAAEKRDK